MITVALIDKQPILRTGLSVFLQDHFEQITILQSESIVNFHNDFPDVDPNLIIVGMNHKANPAQPNFINKVRQWYRIETLIVFDENADQSRISRYLRAGVKGYVVKNASLGELTLCVREVLKGKRYLCSESLKIILDKHFPEKIKPGKLRQKEMPRFRTAT